MRAELAALPGRRSTRSTDFIDGVGDEPEPLRDRDPS